MILPFSDGLMITTAGDRESARLADRHYSRHKIGTRQFVPPGRKLVLRDASGLIVFAWLWSDVRYRLDRQAGYNCTIFRNESGRRSSDVIREAERIARETWGPNRMFTYVDALKIRSVNPGYCFKCAGWSQIGYSKSGLVLLAKDTP